MASEINIGKRKLLRPARGNGSHFDALWWLNPCWPFAGMLLTSLAAAYWISESDFNQFWRTPKYFRWTECKIVLYIISAFLAGATSISLLRPSLRREPDRVLTTSGIPWAVVWGAFWVGFVLTVFGYLVWAIYSVKNGLRPGDLLALMKGVEGTSTIIREKTETIPGVTTLAQLGMGVGIIGVLLGCKFGWRRVLAPLALLSGLVSAHAYFRAERVAFIEFAVPIFVAFVSISRQADRGMIRRWMLTMLPAFSVIFLYALFSVSEYFRSWTNFYSLRQDSFWWFSFIRLIGYYATSLNNGAALMQFNLVRPLPYLTIAWFWKLPVLNNYITYYDLTGVDPGTDYYDLLHSSVNPEFSNPSGIFPVVLDYGLLGAIAFWFCAGVVAMLLYRLFRRGQFTGVLLYPFFYIGLLEAPRVFYWGNGRSFPSWIFLLGIAVAVSVYSQLRMPASGRTQPYLPGRPRRFLIFSHSSSSLEDNQRRKT